MKNTFAVGERSKTYPPSKGFHFIIIGFVCVSVYKAVTGGGEATFGVGSFCVFMRVEQEVPVTILPWKWELQTRYYLLCKGGYENPLFSIRVTVEKIIEKGICTLSLSGCD